MAIIHIEIVKQQISLVEQEEHGTLKVGFTMT